ncbi:hypothetical protein ACP5PY_18075 [Photobacterium leiognathi subsp. mandapamensis]
MGNNLNQIARAIRSQEWQPFRWSSSCCRINEYPERTGFDSVGEYR